MTISDYVSCTFGNDSPIYYKISPSPISPNLALCSPLILPVVDWPPEFSSSPSHLPVHRLHPLLSGPNSPYLHESSSPTSLLFRIDIPLLGSLPSHKEILKCLSPAPLPLAAMEKWNQSLPFRIDWSLSIAQRTSSFIPARASDVLLRIHCRTLQTATRLHNDLIPLDCLNCKRPRPPSLSSQDFEDLPSGSNGPLLPVVSNEDLLARQSLLFLPAPQSDNPLSPSPQDSDETLTHCVLTCPKISPVIESLKRVLWAHCSIDVNYSSELLFALPALRNDGFPIALLQALSFYHIWVARCEKRFNDKFLHPKALLQIILSAFISESENHFTALRSSRSKADRKKLKDHMNECSKRHIFIFTRDHFPIIHPRFKKHWLLLHNFQPP